MDIVNNSPSFYFTGYVNVQTGDIVKGVVRYETIQIQVEQRQTNGGELIVCDVENRKILGICTFDSIRNGLIETMDLTGVDEECVLDLERTGRHWEGGVLNDECPCGYGNEYNDENNLVYEGFMFGDRRVCYGKEYRGTRDMNGLMYEGGYWNGERYGFGKLFDFHNNVEYEGEWMDNDLLMNIKTNIIKSGNDYLLYSVIEEIVMGNNLFNNKEITSLHFTSLFHRLKRIDIGEESFQNVREFVLDGLDKLESVKIGERCFRIDEDESHWGISEKRRDDGVCQITNCPNLRQLEIGDKSFRYFTKFELSNVNSLQSITFGQDCFFYSDCILNGRWVRMMNYK